MKKPEPKKSESKSNPPTKAKLNKLKGKKPKEFVEEVKSVHQIWLDQRVQALEVLGLKDHLLDIACEIADKTTPRKDKTALYAEFIEVLGWAPSDMRDQVIKNIREALDDSPKPKPEVNSQPEEN